MTQPIGFIGLGMMGKPMALRLLSKGFSLHVYNRTKDKAREILEKGAIWCESPSVVMEKSQIVISMITDSEALEEIVNRNDGLLAGATREKIHIDMSTVSPATTKKLERSYSERGAVFLHAPVLGSVPQASDGSLLIFVGGNPIAAHRCEAILSALGRRVWHFEDIQQSGHLKLICNLFIASMITTLSEGLVLGKTVGIPAATVLDVLKDSALGAPMYRTKGEAIRRRNFAPRFRLAHMLKDLDLIREAAESVGAPLPTVTVIRDLFLDASKKGDQSEDYSAVVKVLEGVAGVEVSE
jgi:3-hydroxyisobutyrate dehydrogenase